MHKPDCTLGRGHHCGACHLTFGSLELFDAHRYGHVDNRQCRPVRLAPGQPERVFGHLVTTGKCPDGRPRRIRTLLELEQGIWQTLAAQERNNRANQNLAKARSTRSTLEQSP